MNSTGLKIITTACLALLISSTTLAASNQHIKLEGIEGESKDAAHKSRTSSKAASSSRSVQTEMVSMSAKSKPKPTRHTKQNKVTTNNGGSKDGGPVETVWNIKQNK